MENNKNNVLWLMYNCSLKVAIRSQTFLNKINSYPDYN